MSTIKEILDKHCAHVSIDEKLLQKINQYQVGFVNKNSDHVNFFGGNLLGVYPVRFKNSDLNEWYDGVMEIDDVYIRSLIIKIPGIKSEWVRGTDMMNLTCIWLVHQIYNSDLSDKNKRQGMLDALLILHYKFISSLMAHYFRFTADKSVALATYASLSKKYALKAYGSWRAMLVARCEDIIDQKSIHLPTIKKFSPDDKVQYWITDSQIRMRSVVKNMRAVFEVIRQQDAKIQTTKMVGKDIDGGMILKDLSRNYSPYQRYLHEKVTDVDLFVKPELINVIANAMHTMPADQLVQVLTHTSDHYNRSTVNISDLLDEIVLHAIEYLNSEQSDFLKHPDLVTLVTRLRANYMSSRSTDPSLLKIRRVTDELIESSVKTKNSSVVASLRTGFCLYIVLFTFSMRSYI